MIICNHYVRVATVSLAVLMAVACDAGGPSRTADEFAADSALAADLALANRDTLLVDSIGEYRPPDAAERDTAPAGLGDMSAVTSGSSTSEIASPATAVQPVTETPSALPSSAPVSAGPVAAAPAPVTPAPSQPMPRLTGARACSSPSAENQNECLRVQLAAVDSRMSRIYRALITEMRLQEKVPGSAKDPPSVQKVRVSQRAWLVYRDNECRRRGRKTEGALWARKRARCLGEFSSRRANELADDFSRLTAH